MLLKRFEIKNYRSLEHVVLDNLQEFNVLIGKNNAGKSSVFQALYDFSRFFRGTDISNLTQNIDMPVDVLTNQDTTRQLEIHLTFTLRQHERQQFIHELLAGTDTPHRIDRLLASPFISEWCISFKATASNPTFLLLRETRIVAEDSEYAIIQQMVGNEQQSNPTQRVLHLGTRSRELGNTTLEAELLQLDKTNHRTETTIDTRDVLYQSWIADPSTRWLYEQLRRYLQDAFFFSPFRRSQKVTPLSHTGMLAQDGENLAQVLATLRLNETRIFDAIQTFIHGALPDVGELGVRSIPHVAGQGRIEFRLSADVAPIPLMYMGGGVEQLLMVAVVLCMRETRRHTIFLEEPESHLHAGAQRYLMEQLRKEDRQVFITTHSSTFINAVHPFSLYQVLKVDGTTTIKHCDASTMDDVFEDIGIRNSDVLLSDAVVFVEGKSDKDTLIALAETMGMSLVSKNISVLLMQGGTYAHRTAPIRSQLLEEMSGKAPVPHLFLLDRDERGDNEILKLEARLKNRVHFLTMRELENYLLVPRALLCALKAKHADNPPLLQTIATTTEDQVQQIISQTADNLYGIVLLKRIRTNIGGLQDGLFPVDALPTLLLYVETPKLGARIRTEIETRNSQYITGLDIESIVASTKQALDALWAVPENRLSLSPGQELLEAVYQAVGSGYRKTEDAVRIAREMKTEEMHQELKDVLATAYYLVR